MSRPTSQVSPIPVGPGDSFTLTRGWRGEYRVTEPLVKQFAIYFP